MRRRICVSLNCRSGASRDGLFLFVPCGGAKIIAADDRAVKTVSGRPSVERSVVDQGLAWRCLQRRRIVPPPRARRGPVGRRGRLTAMVTGLEFLENQTVLATSRRFQRLKSTPQNFCHTTTPRRGSGAHRPNAPSAHGVTYIHIRGPNRRQASGYIAPALAGVLPPRAVGGSYPFQTRGASF